jgi:hypothetical protein
MKTSLGFVVLLLSLCCLRADGQVDIPATVRAAEHFYGAVGSGIDVTVAVSTATVAVGEAATLSVTVTGVTNPAGVTRPPLDTLPAWATKFQIENGPTRTGDKSVTFEYALRPREPGPIALPRLRFGYYNPAAAPGRQLQTTYANSATLAVTERRPEPVAVPERFRTPVGPAGVTLPSPFAVWLTVTGLSLVGATLAWRLGGRHPADAVAIRRQRAHAAATARLRSARTSPDPAAVVDETIRNAVDPLSLPADAVAELSSACDAARFGPGGVNALSLVDRAERLIGGGP